MIKKARNIIFTVILLLCALQLNSYAAEPVTLEFEDMTAFSINPPSGYGEITTEGEQPRYLQAKSSYSGYSIKFEFNVEETARYDMGIWVSSGAVGQNNAIGGFMLDDNAINYTRVYDTNNLKPDEWNLIDLGQYYIEAGTHTFTAKIMGTARLHKFDKMVLLKSNDYTFFSPNEYEKGNFETDDPTAALKKITNASYGYVDYTASGIGYGVTLNTEIDIYGEYDVSVITKGSDTRGKFKAYVNDTPLDTILSAKGFYDYREIELGRVTVVPGNVKIRFEFVEPNTGNGIILSQINFKAVKENGVYVSTPVISGGENLIKGGTNTVTAHISNYGEAIEPVLFALYYEKIGSAKILRNVEIVRPANNIIGDTEAQSMSVDVNVPAESLFPTIEAFVCKFTNGALLPMNESVKFIPAGE